MTRTLHAVLAGLLLAVPATAQPFTFNRIIELGPGAAAPTTDFIGNIAWINDLGRVTVSARPIGAPFGLYLTTDGAAFTLLEGTDDTTFGFTTPQSVTNAGFTAALDNDAINLHRFSPAADEVLAGPNVSGSFPSVNEAGLVAFGDNQQVVTTLDGLSFDVRATGVNDQVVWLNNADQVAFFSSSDPRSLAVVIDDPTLGPRTAAVTDPGAAFPFFSIDPLRLILRDAGDVLVHGTAGVVVTGPGGLPTLEAGEEGLYLVSSVSAAPIAVATLADGFASIDPFRISINESGTAVFGATTTSGQSGLYAAVGGSIVPVIGVGDALFGSVVGLGPGSVGSALTISTGAINEGNVVAFHYQLADGREGVATVVVPEPAAGLAAGLAFLAALRRPRMAILTA